jgi:hypothetical protein
MSEANYVGLVTAARLGACKQFGSDTGQDDSAGWWR